MLPTRAGLPGRPHRGQEERLAPGAEGLQTRRLGYKTVTERLNHLRAQGGHLLKMSKRMRPRLREVTPSPAATQHR